MQFEHKKKYKFFDNNNNNKPYINKTLPKINPNLSFNFLLKAAYFTKF